MSRQKSTFNRAALQTKPLLNIAESQFYLGVSRRTFESLEACDTTFPKRKTPTMHSRLLLDQWLAENGSLFFENPRPTRYSTSATRFALALEQLN